MIAGKLLARLRRRGQAQIPREVAQSTSLLGEQARRLLDDPVLQLVIDVLADDISERWRTTKLGDTAGREELYRLHCALREIEARLKALLGDSERLELERLLRDEQQEDWAA